MIFGEGEVLVLFFDGERFWCYDSVLLLCKQKIGKAPAKTLNAQVGFNVGHSL
jgi:hypothetical protein